MRFLSHCVVAACAAFLTLASSTTACSAEPIPERPAYVPSWLWSALYDSKAYPSLDWKEFIGQSGKTFYIGFHYTTGYTLDCDMGFPDEDSGNRGMGCLGYMPTMGALPLTRSTYPIPSNNHRILTRISMSEDPLPVRAEAPAYVGDPTFYDNTPHFPAGHRLYIPKADPQRFKKLHAYSEKYNYALVCVSKDTNRFGCLRTDNHGFYLDQYGTHTF